MKYQTLRFTAITVVGLVACVESTTPDLEQQEQQILVEELFDEIPNNFPLPATGGFAASFHPAGSVDLSNEFFTNQGTNGRNCGTCHAPEDGWSLRPATATLMFLFTAGNHPLFVNHKDTDTKTCDMSTVSARWNCTTMLRQAKFTRGINVPATRDYEVIAADDPFGVGTTARLWFFRRPLPSANFRSHTVMWDAANTVGTDLREGLIKQARGNVTGAQEGPPATDEVIFDIVDYEAAMSHAQIYLQGAGWLNSGGANGGPEGHDAQALVNGRFDLYDAWEDSSNSKRRQIYRGQELFNNENVASGRTCRGCHNAANSGQNVNGTLFDVGASDPAVAKSDMAVYTFQRNSDGAIIQTTDPGRGIRTGLFADLNKFKTPSLRGLGARAPYFHGGTAKDLEAVVKHYENALGFDFTNQEEADLVAFLNAL